MADIEFSLKVKEGTLDVGLNDEGTITAITVSFSLLQDGLDLIESQAHLYTISTVAVLSRFDNPGIVFLMLPFLLTGFGYFLCPLVIVPQELKILFIFKAFFDVECKGKIVKNILFDFLVVVAHSIEEGFLIA